MSRSALIYEEFVERILLYYEVLLDWELMMTAYF